MDGTQNPRIWKGNDGEARCSYEVTAQVVKFCGGREGGGAPIPTEEPPQAYVEESEIPF